MDRAQLDAHPSETRSASRKERSVDADVSDDERWKTTATELLRRGRFQGPRGDRGDPLLERMEWIATASRIRHHPLGLLSVDKASERPGEREREKCL